MTRRKRWKRLKKHLVYYPAAGAVAIGSMMGNGKVSKIKVKERTESTIRLSSGVSDIQATSDEFLQQAFRRYQTAWRHWEEGKFREAGSEADEVMWLLSGVSKKLDPDQSQIRDALHDRLSELIVLLNEAQSGTEMPSTASVEQLRPVQLEMNEDIQREIERYSTTQRSTFLQGYQLAGSYMSYIHKKLGEHGMPKELGWLPLIESGFKPQAQTGAKALGLWQFMPATGTQYGLVRNRWIDRRLDPERSTEAAVVYLKYLYNRFGGDWNKALAAYNWGEGNVSKAIQRCRRPEDQVTFWDLQERLPEETRRYVPKFLAAVAIARSPEQFGFEELGSRKVPQRYETVQIEKQMDMDVVAKQIGVEPRVLADLNPELRQRVTPPQQHALRVPPGLGSALLAQVDVIPEYKPQPQTRPPSDMMIAKSRRRGGGTLMTAAARKKSTRIRRPSAAATSRAKAKSSSGKKSGKTSARTAKKSRAKSKRSRSG